MYVIIIGAGKVGYFLGKALLSEEHEVLLIEKEAERCEAIIEELGSICLRGDGCETSTLTEAGTNRCDMFIAVTDADEDNLVSCQVAKKTFNVPRAIALVNNPRNEYLFKKLGIDVTVSSTALILEHIEQQVPTHPMVHLFSLGEGELEIVEVRMPQEGFAIGKAIKDVNLPPGTVVALIIPQDRKPFVPSGDTMLRGGDQLVVVTPHHSEDMLRDELTRTSK